MHMTYNRFSRSWDWHWVLEECHHVKAVYSKLQDSIHVDSLPTETAKALSALEHLLLSTLKAGARRDLEEHIVTAPAFIKHWERPKIFGG